MTTKTQAERLFVHLRRKAHTYLEMEALGISSCPWKRIKEYAHQLKDGERIEKGERNGLVTYRIVKAKECVA
jgi:hypothetical protein